MSDNHVGSQDNESDSHSTLQQLKEHFEKLYARSADKPPDIFEEMAVDCCDRAGRVVHSLIREKRLRLPEFPPALAAAPEELDPHEPQMLVTYEDGRCGVEPNTSDYYETWWLAVLGWLARRKYEPSILVDPQIKSALDGCLRGFTAHRGPPSEIPIPRWRDDPNPWPLICDASIQAIEGLPLALRSAEPEQEVVPSKQVRKRGRPRKYDPAKDAKLAQAWRSGFYRRYAEAAKELGVSLPEFRQALDRDRKRKAAAE